MTRIIRSTKETQIELDFSWPAPEHDAKIDIPCPFLTHMLTLMARRGRMLLEIRGDGDVDIDAHHLTEDIGITFGLAMREFVTTEGISRYRYGSCIVPMDGSLVRIALDMSGRGGLFWEGSFPTPRCGDFDMELVPEFFAGFCRESRTTMHVDILRADNSHHAAEAVFKAVGLALDMSLAPSDTAPSTKGAWL